MLVRGGTNPHYLSNGSLLYAQNGRIMRVRTGCLEPHDQRVSVAVLENVRQSADGAVQLSVARSGAAVFIPGGADASERGGSCPWVETAAAPRSPLRLVLALFPERHRMGGG